jgi:TRAP-type C4-dicarboxylate transport system permease small subunit
MQEGDWIKPGKGIPTTGVPMTWLLVTIVIAGAVAVMLGILAEGTKARSRARGRPSKPA